MALPVLASLEQNKSKNERYITMPSDHYIPFNKSFYESCSIIRDQFRRCTTLMGILPDKASTEYGYISYKSSYDGLKQVDSFIEKPNLERAKLLLKQPNTYGIQVFFVLKAIG